MYSNYTVGYTGENRAYNHVAANADVKVNTPFEKKYAMRQLSSLIDSVLACVGNSVAPQYQRSGRSGPLESSVHRPAKSSRGTQSPDNRSGPAA